MLIHYLSRESPIISDSEIQSELERSEEGGFSEGRDILSSIIAIYMYIL